MKAERGTMSGCSTGSDTASNSLALPAVQSYALDGGGGVGAGDAGGCDYGGVGVGGVAVGRPRMLRTNTRMAKMTTDRASNSLALPALQPYAVAVALAEAYLELVRVVPLAKRR